MIQFVFNLVLIGLATGSLSMTLSRSSLFKAPRDWLNEHLPLAGKLASCGYCLSHWIALGLMLLGQVGTGNLLTAFLCWFAAVTIAGVSAFFIRLAYFN